MTIELKPCPRVECPPGAKREIMQSTGKGNEPVRVMFDIGGHEIEIDDGPITGSLNEMREELG